VDGRGNIYVADSLNNRVVKFNSAGTWLRNLAIGINVPLGVTVDKANVVWVTSDAGDTYAYDASGGYLEYYYGHGTAFFEGFMLNPRGIAVTKPLTLAPYNGAPVIAIADGGSQTVQLFSISAQPTAHAPITSIAGVGGYNAQIAFDSAENVYFTSYNSNLVYKYDKFGAFITSWGSAGSGNGQFSGAQGIAIDDSDNVYIADRNNNRIQKFNSSGGYITQWGSAGNGNGQFNHVGHLATDGLWLYATDESNNRVQKFSFAGAYVRQWGTLGTGNGQFDIPLGIAVDRNRNQVYVGDYNGNRIQQFTVFGDFISVWASTTFNGVLGLATDQHGNVYASDLNNGRIAQFNDAGTSLTTIAQPSANGLGVNPHNGQLYSGTVSGGVISRFSATMGKTDTVGIYRPTTHTFLLRKSLTSGAPDISAVVALADDADIAVTGDWNGDGVDTPGLYRPGTSTFYLWERWSNLSIANADYTFVFGNVGDHPIVGDWNGDGRDGVGVFRTSTGTQYLKNNLVAGPHDYAVVFGNSTDVAVAGDWNGDGASSVGVYRRSDARFHVTNRNFSGSVADDGFYPLGSAGDVPITGDWTHSGYAGIGVFRPGSDTFALKYALDATPADVTFTFDSDQLFRDGFEQGGADIPLAGNWGSVPE
jgi:sugar lactone lactonase YvrE